MRCKWKRKSLFAMFKQKKYDVICLQETYIMENDVEEWKREWGGELFCTSGTYHSCGQIILVRKNFSANASIIFKSKRIIAARLIVNDIDLYVVNVYAPNASKEKCVFFDNVQNVVKDITSNNIIVTGDFNCVLNNDMDITSGEKHSFSVVDKFNAVLAENDLIDTWRMFNPDKKEYTWSKQNPFVARRIDFILSTEEIFDRTIDCNIVSVPFTDHRGYAMVVKMSEIIRGIGYWKFNNSLLKDVDFVTEMNNMLDDFKNEYGYNNQTQWELIKLKIKQLSLEYSKLKNLEKKNTAKRLQTELNDVDKLLSERPTCKETQTKREKIRMELEILEQHKARAAQVRARAHWVEKGEKNTKYFLNLEKSKGNAKVMDSVKNEKGDILTDQMDIIKVQRDYFKLQYSKTVPDYQMSEQIDAFIGETEIPMLSDVQREGCEGAITEQEVLSALKQMKGGTAPGIDGITVEFVKVFWARIGKLITSSFNEGFDNGSLSSSQCKAVITLIHKGKNLERCDLKNWRPISLTNTDYKLLAKCLAMRLSNVIHDIVSVDQVGFIKGRRISTIIRLIDDVSDQLNIINKPGLLLAVDFSQAFDRISKEFMLEAFKKFGFGEHFIKWVQVLMTSAKSCINYCGWLSDFFSVDAGIRQGCPFSPLAFVLAIELLAIKTRGCKNIKGIKHWKKENLSFAECVKIALYADDITLMLNDEHDLRHALNILSEFSLFSGLKINKSKTEAMWLGSKKYCNDTFCDIAFKRKIKVLGIYFCNDKSASEVQENWTERVENIKRLICNWEKRNLSIIGKVCIVKTFLISQLVYIMQALILPDKVLTEMNRILFRFLWRKKDSNRKAFEKVKRNVLCGDFQNGGLNMINLNRMQLSCLLQWGVRLFAAGPSDTWSITPRNLYSTLGPNFVCFHSTVNSKKYKGLELIKSIFWKRVLSAWLDYNTRDAHSCVPNLIWNNSHFLCSGQAVFFKEWIEGGFINITDVVNHNGIVSFELVCRKLGNSANRAIEYNVISSAARFFLKKGNDVESIQNYDMSKVPLFNDKSISTVRGFRKSLDDSNFTEPCSQGFWQRKIDFKLDKSAWLCASETTQEVRLRVLQWKILHNIYPTNILLHKMKIREDNKCSDCRDVVDIIEHFFFECPSLYKFWQDVEQYMLKETGKVTRLSITDVLFGLDNNRFQKSIRNKLNHIILIAKMSISIFRKTNGRAPLSVIFQNHLRLRRIDLSL